MLLLLVILAQARQQAYTNVTPQGTIAVVEVKAPPRPHVPEAELAGLLAHQYVALPPEWLAGPTVTVYDPGPSWPLPKQTIPNRWYENRWDLTPVIHYHPPFVGLRSTLPIVAPRPSTTRIGGVRR